LNKLCHEEYELCLKPYENLTDEEAKLIKTPEHTPYYFELLNANTIKEVKNTDGSNWCELNCSQMSFAPFLSADGMVSIQGDLFQYQDGKSKRMVQAAPTNSNIQRLKQAMVSNEVEGISVVELNQKTRATGTVYFGQPQTTPNSPGGIKTVGLYQFVFDLSYTHTWNGIANNRASSFSFSNSMNIFSRKKKNSLASTYYYYPGDHYVWSNSNPFANTGNLLRSVLVDVNGSPLGVNYSFSISNTINTNDIGQGNAVFSPSFAGCYSYSSPLLNTPPPVLGFIQSYFGTNPVPLMKWNLTGVTPGGASGQTLDNIKN
jgi:hypothetical protein